MTTLLPSNATPLEKAMDLALAPGARLLPVINSILSLKHVTRPAGIMPFLVFEYGLEPLRPYVANLYNLIDEGRQWARYRGTHKAVYDGLGFTGYSGAIVNPPARRIAWADFQIALDRIRDTEEDLFPIDGVVGLSSPVRSRLRRVYHGHNIPAAENGYTRHGDAIWGDDSGARVSGSDVKWSFGRDHDFAGVLDEAALTAIGAWIPSVPSDYWVDASVPWVDSDYPWEDPAEQSRRATIGGLVASVRTWLKFTDENGVRIGYRRAQILPVRSAATGDFEVQGIGYSRSNDNPTHILVYGRTGFGDGARKTATNVSALIGGWAVSSPGKLWRTDTIWFGTELGFATNIPLGETVRDKVQILLEII